MTENEENIGEKGRELRKWWETRERIKKMAE